MRQFFADPGVLKVMHGADHDVRWLQRDFGVEVVNLFDTGQARALDRLPPAIHTVAVVLMGTHASLGGWGRRRCGCWVTSEFPSRTSSGSTLVYRWRKRPSKPPTGESGSNCCRNLTCLPEPDHNDTPGPCRRKWHVTRETTPTAFSTSTTSCY
jgi:hypothetical protein